MQKKQLTIPANVSQDVIGYWINSGVSDKSAAAIAGIQHRLEQRFPGAIWSVPRTALHITLMGWVDPLHDYDRDKDELFRTIEAEYSVALGDILEPQPPIEVAFDTIAAFPGTIIVRGQDGGSYQRLRDQFIERIELLPGTKQPPTIIHATICKFLKPIDLAEVKDFLKTESLSTREKISEFRLAREAILYMVEYDTLKKFSLA